MKVTRGEVARGAALVGLARMGSLIEAVAQPLFIWLYGLSTYGLYVVLWGSINLLSNIVDLSMTSALQRVVPGTSDEDRIHAAVKLALMFALVPAIIAAILIVIFADTIAPILSAAPADRATLPTAIRLFAPALPIWVFIEVSTSAARARRAFGPEVRLRIFWEQIARIVFAILFFAIGAGNLGLVAAHLGSLTLTALLCLPLLSRYYRLADIRRARVPRGLPRLMLVSGAAILPANLSRRLLIDAPPVALNLMLPGTGGAVAAGLFEIARKLSTVPLIVRQALQYVLAPLSSAQAHIDRSELGALYRFACRLSTALVVPLCGLLIFAGADILSVYRREAEAALPLLALLVTARAIDAIVGPATSIVEMAGHRLLPLLNSLLGVLLWAGLTFLLVPKYGAWGMAVAVAAATIVIAYAATIELRLSDGISAFDYKLVQGLSVALAGVALMALAEYLFAGPVRFASVLALWAVTCWLALRFGLNRPDREALGGLATRLRLV